MKDINSHVVDEFNIYKNKFWQFTNLDNSWKDVPEKRKLIYTQFSKFNNSHSNNSEHIDKVIKCLLRGSSLIESAINWHQPYIGIKNKNSAQPRASQ